MEEFRQHRFWDHAGDAVGGEKVTVARSQRIFLYIHIGQAGLADAAGEGVSIGFGDADILAHRPQMAGFVFHTVILGELQEPTVFDHVATGVSDVGECEAADFEQAVGKGAADAERRVEPLAQFKDCFAGGLGECRQIIAARFDAVGDKINGVGGGFGSAGQSSDTVGDAKQTELFVAQETIFVFRTDFANIS